MMISSPEINLAKQSIENENALDFSKPLDWRDRPDSVKKQIEAAWQRLVEDYRGRIGQQRWGENGMDEYGLCAVSEHNLIKTLIKTNLDRKEFYVLDIGAGEFDFGRALAEVINADLGIQNEVKVHIISLRAEPNREQEIKTIGRCTLYEYGVFKVEDLLEQFKARNLDLNNKVDVIVSRWSFRHLVDPLGTFLQAYSLLRAKTGFLLMDGFYFCRENGSKKEQPENFQQNMHSILLETKAPFLVYGQYTGSRSRSLDQFILQKPDEKACKIALRYSGLKPLEGVRDIAALCLTSFKSPIQDSVEALNINKELCKLSGDKSLYEFLDKHSLFNAKSKDTVGYIGSFLKDSGDKLALSPKQSDDVREEAITLTNAFIPEFKAEQTEALLQVQKKSDEKNDKVSPSMSAKKFKL